MQTKLGGSVCYSLSEHGNRHVVIPIPNLAMRSLIRANGWPLASVTTSSGPPKSQKSSFSFEVARWYLEAGGACLAIDTENKLSPTLLYSLVDPMYAEPPMDVLLQIMKTRTTEEWQTGVANRMEALEDILEKAKKKPEFPTFVLVDSVGAAGSEAMTDSIGSSGSAPGKGFSDVAQLNTQFMRYLSAAQVGMPITTHFVNHEKNRMDGSNGKVNPGGDAIPYHSCLNLRFSPARMADKEGSKDGDKKKGASPTFSRVGEDGLRVEGRNLLIKPTFNSFASNIASELTVAFMWKYVPQENGTFKQLSWWDWDTATANVILDNKKDLETVLGKIERKKNDSNCIVTDVFGELSFLDLGKQVNSSPEVLSKCTDALRIPRHPEFEAGKMDFPHDLERLAEVKKGRAKAAKKKKDKEDAEE